MNARGLVIGITACGAIFAQTPAPKPQFEVASTKQNTTCGGRKEKDPIPHPGALTIPCIALKDVIQLSYVMFANSGARNPEKVVIVGGPAWINSTYFDIAAKADGAPVDSMVGPMLRALLEDRFRLQVHRDKKDAPVFLLTVAKGGPKLQATTKGACTEVDFNHPPAPLPPGQARPRYCGSRSM